MNISIKDLMSYGLMGLVVFAFLGFVSLQVLDLVQAFVDPKLAHEEHHSADLYEGLSLAEEGELIFTSEGCMACHNLDLVGGVLGPSLNNVGNRWSEDELRTMIVEPVALVPGTYMPSFAHLEDHQVDALVAFLGTLDHNRQGPDNVGTALVTIPLDSDVVPIYSADAVDNGRDLFQSKGCIGCHSINGLLQAGVTGPNLTYEGLRGRDDEWQAEHIKNPIAVYINGPSDGISWKMNPFANLTEDELTNIVAYLQSLNGIESLMENYSSHCSEPENIASAEESNSEASRMALLFQKKYCPIFEELSTPESN
jgi:sulfur oxidation c-type cytochrome SoxX